MIIIIENTPSLDVDDLLLSGVVFGKVVAVVLLAPVDEVVPVVVLLRGVVDAESFEQIADDLSSNIYAQPFSLALFSSIILKTSLS